MLFEPVFDLFGSQKCCKGTQKSFTCKQLRNFFPTKDFSAHKIVILRPGKNIVIMSQRLQSIFFFLSALLFALLFFFPLASYYGEYNTLDFNVFGVTSPDKWDDGTFPFKNLYSLPVLILTITVVLLSGYLAMGLFRAVKLAQFVKLHKIARINIIVIVAWISVVFAYYVRVIGNPVGATATYRLGIFLPLAALLMSIAAASGLKKDIKKVRSTDRIR